MVERSQKVKESASFSLKRICGGSRSRLQEMIPNLLQLYVRTMNLNIRMHLNIVEGVAIVVNMLNTGNQQDIQSSLEQLVTPLVNGLNTEMERPNILSEILDRLTTIIQNIKP